MTSLLHGYGLISSLLTGSTQGCLTHTDTRIVSPHSHIDHGQMPSSLHFSGEETEVHVVNGPTKRSARKGII